MQPSALRSLAGLRALGSFWVTVKGSIQKKANYPRKVVHLAVDIRHVRVVKANKGLEEGRRSTKIDKSQSKA